MDSKYGHLFTEEDVKNILHTFGVQLTPDQEDAFNNHDTKFPRDEPLFLLRGKDRDALSGLYGYAEGIDNDEEVGQDHKDAVQGAIDNFTAFKGEDVPD